MSITTVYFTEHCKITDSQNENDCEPSPAKFDTWQRQAICIDHAKESESSSQNESERRLVAKEVANTSKVKKQSSVVTADEKHLPFKIQGNVMDFDVNIESLRQQKEREQNLKEANQRQLEMQQEVHYNAEVQVADAEAEHRCKQGQSLLHL